jgi:hypothetical protein
VVTAAFSELLTATVSVSLSGNAGGTVTATGQGINQTCSRPSQVPVSGPATLCSWTIPRGVSFTVTLTGSASQGFFIGANTDLCYEVSSPCTISGGITGNRNLSVYFF